jgi:phytanoyl-CoA hydroxylase
LASGNGKNQTAQARYLVAMTGLADEYMSEGFVVVEGLVSDQQRQAVSGELLAFARGDYPVENPPAVPEDATDEQRLAQILAVHFPHWVSPIVADMVRHPRIAAVLGEITGAHIPYWDGRVKCMQSMLFAKPPGLPGQAWHQDERYIPTRDRSLIGAWIALDDADEENGCLRVLPRSHRTGELFALRDHGLPEEFDPGEEAYGFDPADERLLTVKAGDVVFFNGYLLHRSLRNASVNRNRRALVNHYCSAWSNLPWMTRQGIDVGTADYRAIVPVVGEDPYPERPIEPGLDRVFLRPASGAFVDAQEIIAD